MVVLAGLCVAFGVFAFRLPLRYLIQPAVPGVSFSGIWWAGRATLLIAVGVIIGGIIYWLGNLKSMRENTSYVGGEMLPSENRITGVDFYGTIKDFSFFGAMYQKAEQKLFDLYELLRGFVFYFVKAFRAMHTGVLPIYLSWCLIGLVVLLFILMKGIE
ncbi:hypothetical protein LR007_04350 [candidate division NPL-UPA2 bacterium]|nr:hypothetical protein [candidate division NPL-UPA2 bacterium]